MLATMSLAEEIRLTTLGTYNLISKVVSSNWLFALVIINRANLQRFQYFKYSNLKIKAISNHVIFRVRVMNFV